MHKLYQKSEIWFSVLWIVVYVVGASITDELSRTVGAEKSVTFAFLIALCVVAIVWMKKHGLFKKYGLCRTDISPSRFLFYIPLIVVASCNLWFGVGIKFSVHETVFYIVSMICVGFLEEFIFRGLLFRAMSRDNVRAAIVVSSLTFGIGHVINLFNGNGADLVSNLCQVFSAAAFGFLFVIIFYRSCSLLPCILAHSTINSLNAFAKEIPSREADVIASVILTLIAVGYTLVLLKTLPKGTDKKQIEGSALLR